MLLAAARCRLLPRAAAGCRLLPLAAARCRLLARPPLAVDCCRLTCLLLLRRSVSAFWRERRGRLALVAGVLVAGSGGVGAEVVHYYMEYFGDPGPLAEVIQVAVEEGLELVGETVIIFGMLTKVVGLQPGGGDSRRVEEAHGRA